MYFSDGSRSVYISITCSSSASAQREDKQVNRYQWRKAVANMWKILCSHSSRLPMISPKRRLQKHQKNPLLTVLFQIAAGHPAPCLIFFIPVKDTVCCTCFLQFTSNVKLALDAEFLFDGNFQLTVAQYDFLEKGPDAPPGCPLAPLVFVPNKVRIPSHVAEILLYEWRKVEQLHVLKNVIKDFAVCKRLHL